MLITITDSVIDTMRRNKTLLALLPCLARPPAAVSPLCNSCTGGSRLLDYNSIKLCLAGLDSRTLKKVKAEMGADKFRVYYPTTKNGVPGTLKRTF